VCEREPTALRCVSGTTITRTVGGLRRHAASHPTWTASPFTTLRATRQQQLLAADTGDPPAPPPGDPSGPAQATHPHLPCHLSGVRWEHAVPVSSRWQAHTRPSASQGTQPKIDAQHTPWRWMRHRAGWMRVRQGERVLLGKLDKSRQPRLGRLTRAGWGFRPARLLIVAQRTHLATVLLLDGPQPAAVVGLGAALLGDRLGEHRNGHDDCAANTP
jgi:hypothetical protein